ncbi:MAG: VOC family protein [Isosphaeraceae bacterium]|nr:VOC family protein [Isosphaeraceae bacterium]
MAAASEMTDTRSDGPLRLVDFDLELPVDPPPMHHTICHFEIPATDPERIAAFYRTVFDWKIDKVDVGGMEYWMVETVPTDASGRPTEPGVNGGILRKMHPQQPCANHIQVEDVSAFLERIVAEGGQVALPKTPVPGIGWIGYFKDPEANIVGLFQADPAA